MKSIAYVLGLLICVLAPTNTLGHSQGGPPYLLVNGDYAQTNPLANAYPDDVPQDFTNQVLVAGQQIEFSIDLNVVAPDTEFRWAWSADRPEDYQYGNSVNHAYKRAGSYVLLLLAKNTGTGNQFIPYDTVRLNIVPHAGYHVPFGTIKASLAHADGNKKLINFSIAPHHDSSSRISSLQWFFGDGQTASGASLQHMYDQTANGFTPMVIMRDDNGIIGLTAVSLDLSKSTAQTTAVPFLPNTGQDSTSDDTNRIIYIALSLVGLAAIMGVIFFAIRLKQES